MLPDKQQYGFFICVCKQPAQQAINKNVAVAVGIKIDVVANVELQVVEREKPV